MLLFVCNFVGNEVISFDGIGGGIVDLTTTLSCVQGNNPRSISFMIQTTSTSQGYILSTGSFANRCGSFAVFFNDAGRIGVHAYYKAYIPTTGKIINDGLWHTVLVTYNGTTLLIYADGILDNTANNWNINYWAGQWSSHIASTLDTVGNELNVLGHGIWANDQWIGQLKNVIFYDYALTNHTMYPTIAPTVGVTGSPTIAPTVGVTGSPTIAPTVGVTGSPTIAPTVDYLTTKEANQFKEELIKSAKKFKQKMEEEFESFKKKQEKIIKKLKEELKNLKEK